VRSGRVVRQMRYYPSSSRDRVTEGMIAMPRRYSTEIRGDGTTRTWTLPHSLDDPTPTMTVRDAAHHDVSGSVRFGWPSPHEVAITFALPPPVG
jgi:hypothetical protein